MNNTMKYKGYQASIFYSGDDAFFYGQVLCTNDIICFDGVTVDELERMFHEAIDQYLNECEEEGKPPGQPICGEFKSIIPPENLAQELLKYRDDELTPHEIDSLLVACGHDLSDKKDDSRERFWTYWKSHQRIQSTGKKQDLKKAI
jgi:predicted HicB family RNase H-like nuclease